jgi:hypothetical protein
VTEAPERKALRRSLVAGAVYDLVLGCFILVVGSRVMASLGHPVTGFEFYFTLAAAPLLLLAVLYAVAAVSRPIDVFRAPVLWARGGGGVIILLLTAVHRPGAAWLFFVIGAVDLLWAALHAALWRTARS